MEEERKGLWKKQWIKYIAGDNEIFHGLQRNYVETFSP